MTEAIRYGQMESEKRADENKYCRQIVKEINLQGGLTQRQTMVLIYLLAAELENIEHMKALTKQVRELGGEELFVSGGPEDGSTDA